MGTYCHSCGTKRCWCDEKCEHCCRWYTFICTNKECDSYEAEVAFCSRCYYGYMQTCDECYQDMTEE